MKPLDHTLRFTGPDHLEELTLQALTTPSLDAEAALAVLADALVERDLIRAPRRTGSGRQKERAARGMLCKRAFYWASQQCWEPRWWRDTEVAKQVAKMKNFDVNMRVRVEGSDGIHLVRTIAEQYTGNDRTDALAYALQSVPRHSEEP